MSRTRRRIDEKCRSLGSHDWWWFAVAVAVAVVGVLERVKREPF